MTRASNRMLRNRQLAQKRRTVLWTPGKLFTTGVNGAWYDPSDMTTLFQDAAGTTPVTAVEQPVGLMKDKSGKSPTTWLQKIADPSLTTTTGWSNPAVFSGGKYISGNSSYSLTATIGKFYRYTYTVSTASAGGLALYVCGVQKGTSSPIAAGTYSGTVIATSTKVFEFYDPGWGWTGQIDSVSVEELQGNHAFQSSSANRPTLSARYNLLTKSEHILDASIGQYLTTKISNTSWTFEAPGASRLYWGLSSNLTVGVSYRLSATFSAADIGKKIRFAYYDTGYNISPTDIIIDSNGYAEWVFTAVANTGIVSIYSASTGGAITYTFASSKGFSCTVANDALNQPAYQRVNTASDYDTVGFKPYLNFTPGTKWLQTNSIDFTSTAQMFVSAGVRKLSDAATGIVYELSTATESVLGGFYLTAPNTGAGASYQISTRSSGGGNMPIDVNGIPAPITNVSTSLYDLSVSSMAIRFNGITNTTRTGGAGGVFGNYPLYIGARAGSSLWFNGRIYQLVVAGKQVTDTELLQTEDYMELKTFNKDMGYVYNYLVDASGNPVTDASGNPIYVSATYQ